MRWRQHRSLLFYLAVRIVAPLSVAMIALLVAAYILYQQAVVSLLLDRDSEMATLSADNVQHEVREYTLALQTAARDPDLLNAAAEPRLTALRDSASRLAHFYTGLGLLDARGNVVGHAGPDSARAADFAALAVIAANQGHVPSVNNPQPSVSDVVIDPCTGANYVVIGAPLFDRSGNYAGALLGSASMQVAEMSELLAALTIGERGFAYLVDRKGHVIYHREPRQTGADLSALPFVQRVRLGESGGQLWTSPEGEPLIVDYAPVVNTGWGVITQEPWEVAVSPIRLYEALLLVIGLFVIAGVLALLWRGVRRIATPLGWLAEQSTRLTEDDAIEPAKMSGIVEIDTLGSAFDTMAAQINSYRAGLRRYAGAITQTLEEERRRIARELHDETAQNLSAIARQIEIHQANANDPAYAAQLAELRGSVTGAMQSVRQIIRDLRPRLLEDLGLIPALELLLQTSFEEGAPHVTFDVIGQPRPLGAKRELSLYRVVQEAATNVRKHAQANTFSVRLAYEPQRVQLDISDDGHGFVVPVALSDFIHTGHLGLMGMQERVWSAGGLLTIDSALGQGVRLHINLPTLDGAA